MRNISSWSDEFAKTRLIKQNAPFRFRVQFPLTLKFKFKKTFNILPIWCYENFNVIKVLVFWWHLMRCSNRCCLDDILFHTCIWYLHNVFVNNNIFGYLAWFAPTLNLNYIDNYNIWLANWYFLFFTIGGGYWKCHFISPGTSWAHQLLS